MLSLAPLRAPRAPSFLLPLLDPARKRCGFFSSSAVGSRRLAWLVHLETPHSSPGSEKRFPACIPFVRSPCNPQDAQQRALAKEAEARYLRDQLAASLPPARASAVSAALDPPHMLLLLLLVVLVVLLMPPFFPSC